MVLADDCQSFRPNECRLDLKVYTLVRIPCMMAYLDGLSGDGKPRRDWGRSSFHAQNEVSNSANTSPIRSSKYANSNERHINETLLGVRIRCVQVFSYYILDFISRKKFLALETISVRTAGCCGRMPCSAITIDLLEERDQPLQSYSIVKNHKISLCIYTLHKDPI